MEFYVEYHSSEGNSEIGRTKLSVPDLNTTTIKDVKYMLQGRIQVPVCDQQLFYQERALTVDQMSLGRLYFREGDTLNLQFTAAADIQGMTELLNVLKKCAREIEAKLENKLPDINEDSEGVWRFYDRLLYALEGLASFFFPWKCLRSVAQRHFFVQEEGFDAFLKVFKLSRQLYLTEQQESDLNLNANLREATTIRNHLKLHFNQGQLVLQLCCLSFLWNFGETPQDRKFLLSKDVFPLTVDALLLQPSPLEKTGHIDMASLVVGVNESAVGCFGGLVECNSNIQEEVSNMPAVINKLLFMIDRCQSEPAGYSLFSSQVASNSLFYCTFNVKSAQSLVNCGAVEKVLLITKALLDDKDGNTPLRYYCCLFLARIRSAPLVKLDMETCMAIDELINLFLDRHVPNEISKWEEEMSFVWMTMVPLVHLAFAGGKEYNSDSEIDCDSHGNEINLMKCDSSSHNGEACFSEKKLSPPEGMEIAEADTVKVNDSQSSFKSLKTVTPEDQLVVQTVISFASSTAHNAPRTNQDKNVLSENPSKVERRKDKISQPGSSSTQKLGIFSLVHMLSIEENQQLALLENLPPFLVCLSWHLPCDGKEKLRKVLANNVHTPPSLKVVAKSVLALVKGLDMVFNL
ncbi:uncharacterized protein LOC111337879 [Stylophora pistillata]|uniref:uncharacterized protein LOC111337879 n=1 Tax=Stylophora pistillata TaxID=50429 RepID=UPI000C03C102|nr:uncharacterized protein LOC111337879 [Stylophora pistillata]